MFPLGAWQVVLPGGLPDPEASNGGGKGDRDAPADQAGGGRYKKTDGVLAHTHALMGWAGPYPCTQGACGPVLDSPGALVYPTR